MQRTADEQVTAAYAAFDKWVAEHEDEVGHITLLEQIDAYKSAWDKLVENPTDRP